MKYKYILASISLIGFFVAVFFEKEGMAIAGIVIAVVLLFLEVE